MGWRDKKKILDRFTTAVILYFVSDRAKALIHLAKETYKVNSIADLFHFKYCINCLLTLALSAQLRAAKGNFETEQNQTDELINREEQYGKMQYIVDYYVERVRNLTHLVHPFFEGNHKNRSERTNFELTNELDKIKEIVAECKITDKHNLIDKAARQIPDISVNIDWWWTMVNQNVEQMKLSDATRKWFMENLLPTAYWNYAITKTKHRPTLDILKSELLRCPDINVFGKQLEKEEFNKLQNEANNYCRLFQRASSQVEGRNGYLAMMNHTQRGFDKQRLEVLTVVHNFDTRRCDGLTPAERLFGTEINEISIFDFLVNKISELPYPRSRKRLCADY